MSDQDKARKLAEEFIRTELGSRFNASDELTEKLAQDFLQFAQERESEAVGELVELAKEIKPATLDRNFWSRSIEILCIKAAALIAKHSRKGAKDE